MNKTIDVSELKLHVKIAYTIAQIARVHRDLISKYYFAQNDRRWQVITNLAISSVTA